MHTKERGKIETIVSILVNLGERESARIEMVVEKQRKREARGK